MKYDYLIVGAGLFGSVIARELTNNGNSCLVIDKRSHIGGNCYTKDIDNIKVHMYGPHIFHTSNDDMWCYINSFTNINNFTCRPKLYSENKIYSFPVNLMTLNQIYHKNLTPIEAKKLIDEETSKYRKLYKEPKNAEEYALSNISSKVYETCYKGYLKKQWNRDPKDIPADIMKRQVIRFDYNDSYYNDKYQGIPDYDVLFNNLLDGIEVKLKSNYLENTTYYDDICDKVIYTGAIDEYYDFIYGCLEYRGLEFVHEKMDLDDYQGVFMVSFPNENEYTRIIEHKHFVFGKQKNTIITKEYPKDWKIGDEPYYPVNDEKNQKIHDKYNNIKNDKTIFGGRQGSYKYLNMDQTIGRALQLKKKLINK
jgi:UDP-galactopyranose mutase